MNDILNKQILSELTVNVNRLYLSLSNYERKEIETLRKKYKKRFNPSPNSCCGYDQTYLFYCYLQRAKKRIGRN